MNRSAVLGGLYIALAAVIFSTMEVLLKLPAVAGAFHPLQITMERFVVGGIVVTCFSVLFGAAELFVLLLLGHTGPGAALYQAVGLDVFCDVPFLQGINATTLPYFLFIGVVNCAGGYVFHMLAIEKTSATHGSLVFFFKPILAPLFALAVLGEAITRPIALGILCFLAGSLLSILPEVIREHRAKRPQIPHTEGTE